METLLILLKLNARQIATDCAVIKQSHVAMQSMQDDMIAALHGRKSFTAQQPRG